MSGGFDGEYWFENLRRKVDFAGVVGRLMGAGQSVFVEVGVNPGLLVGIEQTAAELGVDVVCVGSLRRGQGGLAEIVRNAARLWVRGVQVNWAPLFGGARRTDIPAYPFQHQHFWVDAPDRGNRVRDLVDTADVAGLAGALGGAPDERLAELLDGLAEWRREQIAQVRYRVEWHPVPAGTEALTGRWLAVLPGSGCPEPPPGMPAIVVDHADRAALARQLGREPATSVLSFLAFGPDAAARTAVLMQALGDVGNPARLWCVTSGAVSTGPDDRLRAPEQAQVWGFGRVAALEQPHRWGGLIDLRDGPIPPDLMTALHRTDGEDQLAIRTDGVFARRVAPAPPVAIDAGWTPPPGTVLITGGSGALGLYLARWLVDRGAENVVRTGRTAAGPGTVRCDASDRDAMSALFDRLADEGRPVRSVFHLAGEMDRTRIDALTPQRMHAVLRSKADSARVLHELTADRDVRSFVLFSSIAGVWGSGDNAAYAAANAYLDALAAHRAGLGLPATSIGWGPWAGDGMMARDGFGELVHRHGVHAFPPDRALAELGRCLDAGEVAPIVVDVAWPRFRTAFTATRSTRLFDPIVGEASDSTEVAPVDFPARLAALPPAERADFVAGLVRDAIDDVLGYTPADRPDPDQSFRDLGLDSVSAVELRNRISRVTGLSLPVTLAFEQPSPARLTGHLLSLSGSAVEAPDELDGLDVDEAELEDLIRSVLGEENSA